MSFLKKLEAFVGLKKANVNNLCDAALAKPQMPVPEDKVEKLRSQDQIEITPEYKEVIRAIEAKDPFIFVSGKAGTGKTTLIGYLREKLAGNVVVVAPTGVAALQVNGVTIHSFFRLPPRIIFPEEDIKLVKDRRLYACMRLLIIDEISMVRADTLDAIDLFLKKNGPKINEPFGGIQVMFVGDLFQLPPVISTSEMNLLQQRGYKTAHFFGAKVLGRKDITAIELGKIFRQKDERFTNLLNNIRVNEEITDALITLNKECYENPQIDTSTVITLTTTNMKADNINERELASITGKTYMFVGLLKGKFNVEEKNLPSPINLSLKIGARVMFTANDKEKKWVNGTVGIVKKIIGETVQVEIKEGNNIKVVDVNSFEWKSYKYEFDIESEKIKPVTTGSYQQIPLTLAWSMTIHKSQGKSLDSVCIDLTGGTFAPGQAYVALSRCRTLSGIKLENPIKASDIKCSTEIKRFYEALIN